MSALSALGRNQLEKVMIQARESAESAAQKALEMLAVAEREPWPTMSAEERRMRVQLRAVERRLGSPEALKHACAYEHWHRMLFARFLAENDFLIHPDYCVPVTLEECAELARSAGESDRWTVASRFAARMLPGIFPQDDPLLEVRLPIEDRLRLEGLLESLPVEVFTSDDGLGWTYQFWQAKRKEEAQSANKAYSADDIPAVTQLFTERYMVQFLLQNTLGAWWLSVHPDSPMRAEWCYYRPEVQHDFSTWPDRAAKVRVIDPCCGSGHFLAEAFQMLRRMRVEEGESPSEAAAGALQDNLFGLELDARCVQIAAFAMAMAAWKAGCPIHDTLPIPNVACCGLPLGASMDEWREIANGNTWLADALTRLHELFSNAQELGSLVDPVNVVSSGTLFSVDSDEALRHLEQALARERNVADPVAKVFGEFARGALKAFRILIGKYHLAVTNPPFLTRGKQSESLRRFCSDHFADAKKDLATCFVERCGNMTVRGGYYSIVNPQNWTFLTSDKVLRSKLLRERAWRLFARLGPKAFATNLWDFNAGLFVLSNTLASEESRLFVIDAMKPRLPMEKAKALRTDNGLMVDQMAQLNNPGSRVVLGMSRPSRRWALGPAYQGLITVTIPDLAVSGKCLPCRQSGNYSRAVWLPPAAMAVASISYCGRRGALAGNPGADSGSLCAWTQVSVQSDARSPVTLYTGEFATILPQSSPEMPLTFLLSGLSVHHVSWILFVSQPEAECGRGLLN